MHCFLKHLKVESLLKIDEAAANQYGEVMGIRKEIGRPLDSLDGQIIAIARANTSAVATRNTQDFDHCGLTLINPFLPN